MLYHLVNTLNIPNTKAADFASIMLGKSDCTIRQWKADFLEHGSIPENKMSIQGFCGHLKN